MANLDWQGFESLGGNPRENWELLCREVVRRNYDQFGSLLTRRQQPGVEFHLELLKPGSDLGPVGGKWGWQCKWFDSAGLKGDGSLRADQRRSIEESIDKSHKHVEGLTDWVLWTREKLTADDLRWFEALTAPFVLRHWDEETLAGLLSGPAEPLRATWFGELILDDEVLAERRRETLAPIRQRYVEELHLRTSPEEEIDELLLGIEFEQELTYLREEVQLAAEDLETFAADARQEGAADLHRLTIESTLEVGQDLESLGARSRTALPPATEIEAMVGRAAGALGHMDNLANALDRRRSSMLVAREARTTAVSAHRFLSRLAGGLRTPLLVVFGSAGAGKTHLAASISGPDEAPRGLIVLGRQFGARIADDDLSRHVGLGRNRDELLEALEALGVREGRRIPLVIDGINESEDPAAWRLALGHLRARLDRLEHVFVVVTLRPTYRKLLALPADIPSVELDGFIGIEAEAVRRYFAYYKIDASPQSLGWWRPSDPLLLSIFCRTVNPERKVVVGADDLPESLVEVLDAYLRGVCEQVGRAMETPPEEIEGSLLNLAWCFYQEDARELDREVASQALGDSPRAKWRESLRFHLEGEEILIRDVVGEGEKEMWSYDLLAGHAIARILLRKLEPTSFGTEEVKQKLERHPLREDIVAGLVGRLGSRSGELLAAFQDNPDLCFDLVQASVHLPGNEVAESVLEELPRLFEERPRDVLDVIERVAIRPGHPLNGEVLDRLLIDLSVRRRDAIWTDWFRQHSGTERSILRISETWRQGEPAADVGATVAWLSWALTTPDGAFRDAVIQALYRIGKREPELLFKRTLQMLDVNDPAVGAGVISAAYGVVMASQLPSRATKEAIVELASELRSRVLDEAATDPPSHWLVREYSYRIMQFAAWISDGEFAAPTAAAQPAMPQIAGADPVRGDGHGWTQIRAALEKKRGRIEGRSPSAGLAKEVERLRAADEIAGRVTDFGWNPDCLEPDDDLLPLTETSLGSNYLEKYVIHALHEVAGRRAGREDLSTIGWRFLDPPLDPSFPVSARAPGLELPELPLDLPRWFAPSNDEGRWLEQPADDAARELLRVEFGDGLRWIAIDGGVSVSDGARQRRLSIDIHGMLALEGWGSVESHLGEIADDVDPFPTVRADRALAGEAPWSPTFDSGSTSAEGQFAPRTIRLGGCPGGPNVELLSVPYGTHPSRSPFNSAEIGNLPAKFFALELGLRKLPDLPDFVDQEGRPAARPISFRGVGGIQGHMLYVRDDLLEHYLQQRGGDWGWFLRIERAVLETDPEGSLVLGRSRRSSQTVALDLCGGGCEDSGS